MNTIPIALPNAPNAAVVAAEPRSSSLPATNAVDDFFGSTLSRQPTTESRHDLRRLSGSEILPSYTECPPPPSYSKKDEQPTLAEYLFKFGFIFFPFWIIGACILCAPLTAPPPSTASPTWLPEKSADEREAILLKIRAVEIRWAKYCLYACLTLFIFVPIIAVLIWQLSTAL